MTRVSQIGFLDFFVTRNVVLFGKRHGFHEANSFWYRIFCRFHAFVVIDGICGNLFFAKSGTKFKLYHTTPTLISSHNTSQPEATASASTASTACASASADSEASVSVKAEASAKTEASATAKAKTSADAEAFAVAAATAEASALQPQVQLLPLPQHQR